MVWVPEGGMLQITNRILQAEMPGVSDSALVYTISDQPRYGRWACAKLSSLSIPGVFTLVQEPPNSIVFGYFIDFDYYARCLCFVACAARWICSIRI